MLYYVGCLVLEMIVWYTTHLVVWVPAIFLLNDDHSDNHGDHEGHPSEGQGHVHGRIVTLLAFQFAHRV